MNNDIITLSNGSSAAIYHADSTAPTKFVLYFHGGGFVYGSKSDLPEALKHTFLDAGYTVLAVDYLLAPNAPLSKIVNNAYQSLCELTEQLIKDAPYGLCGRSAGGYLMFLLTKQLLLERKQLPDFLVNFYGYTDLAFLKDERSIFDKKITAAQIATVDLEAPVWDDPHMTRFLLYIYAVQNNLLPDYYGMDATKDPELRITDQQLASFPKLFSSASTMDHEVPFRYSKAAAKKNPNGRFVPLYDLDHDFLKSTEEPQVANMLKKLSEWLST